MNFKQNNLANELLPFVAEQMNKKSSKTRFNPLMISSLNEIFYNDFSMNWAMWLILFLYWIIFAFFAIDISIFSINSPEIPELKSVFNLIRSLFVFSGEFNPKQYLNFGAFYYAMFSVVASVVFYTGLLLFRIRRNLNRFYLMFFFFYCEIFALPSLFLLSFSTVTSISGFFTTNDSYYFLLPLMTFFCLPALASSILRSILEVRINPLPFNSFFPRVSFRMIISLLLAYTLVIVAEYDSSFSNLRKFFLFFTFFLSMLSLYHQIRTPPFLNRFMRIATTLISLMVMINSLIGIIISMISNMGITYILVLVIGLNSCSLVFSFVIDNRILSEGKFLLSQTPRINPKNYSLSQNLSILISSASNHSFKGFNSQYISDILLSFPDAIEISIIVLRFQIYNRDLFFSTFQDSIKLLMFNPSSYFISSQLISLLDITSESVLVSNENIAVRQNQLNGIIGSCYAAHYSFWRAVLLGNEHKIANSIEKLTDLVLITQDFIEQIHVNPFEDDQFGFSYFKYIAFITCDLYKLNDKEIDFTNAVPHPPYTQNKKSRAEDIISKNHSSKIFNSGMKPSSFSVFDLQSIDNCEYPYGTVNDNKYTINRYVQEYKFTRMNVYRYSFTMIFVCQLLFCLGFLVYFWITGWKIFTSPSVLIDMAAARRVYYNVTGVALEYLFNDYLQIDSQFYGQKNSLALVKEKISLSKGILQENNYFIESVNFSKAINVHEILVELSEMNYSFHNSSEIERLKFGSLLLEAAQTEYNISEEFFSSSSLFRDSIDHYFHHFVTSTDKALYRVRLIGFVFVFILIIICSSNICSMKRLFSQPQLLSKQVLHKIMKSYQSLLSESDVRNSEIDSFYDKIPYYISFNLKIVVLFILFSLSGRAFKAMFLYLFGRFVSLTHGMTNANLPGPLIVLSAITISGLYFNPNSTHLYKSVENIVGTLKALNVDLKNRMEIVADGVLNNFSTLNITRVDTMQGSLVFPLSNSTLSYDFLHVIANVVKNLIEILIMKQDTPEPIFYSNFRSIMMLRWKSRPFHDLLEKDTITKLENLSFVLYVVSFVFIFIWFFIFYWILYILSRYKEFPNLLLRILSIIPENPICIDEKSYVIDIWKDPPESIACLIMDSFPYPVIISNSDTIIYSNQKSINLFGFDLSGEQASSLHEGRLANIDGVFVHFKYKRLPMSNFPYEGISKIYNGKYLYILFDETELRTEENTLKILQDQIETINKIIIPPLTALSYRPPEDNISIIEKFAMIDIVFPPRISHEQIISLRENFRASLPTTSSLYYWEIKQFSSFFFFAQPHTHYNHNQYKQDCSDIAFYILRHFHQSTDFSKSKIVAVSSEKCICRITATKATTIRILSDESHVSLPLLRLANESELIIQRDLICQIPSGLKESRSSYIQLSKSIIHYRVITHL